MDRNYYIFDNDNLIYIQTDVPTKIIKHVKKVNKVIVLCIFILVFPLLLLLSKYHNDIEKINYEKQELIEQIDIIQNECNHTNVLLYKAGEFALHPHKLKNELSDSTVSDLLIELGAWFPDIKLAQYHIESGMGTSNVAINSNNICGMRKTYKRETTQLKDQDYHGYGVYNNWESCIIDHILYDYNVFRYRKPSRSEYIEHLNSMKYSTTEGYGDKVDLVSKKYQVFFE